MHLTTFSIILAQSLFFINYSFAEELNAASVPSKCKTICQPMVQLTNTCDVNPGEAEMENGGEEANGGIEPDEPIEARCVCNNKSFDVPSIAALCASCIKQNGKATVDDMDRIMSACSFSSTSYAPSATALVAKVTVSATKPATTALGAAGSATSTGSGRPAQSTPAKGLGTHMNVPIVFGLCMSLLGLSCSIGVF